MPFDGRKATKIEVNVPDALNYSKLGLSLLGQFQNLCNMRGQVVGSSTVAFPGGPTFTLYVNPVHNLLQIDAPTGGLIVPKGKEAEDATVKREEHTLPCLYYYGYPADAPEGATPVYAPADWSLDLAGPFEDTIHKKQSIAHPVDDTYQTVQEHGPMGPASGWGESVYIGYIDGGQFYVEGGSLPSAFDAIAKNCWMMLRVRTGGVAHNDYPFIGRLLVNGRIIGEGITNASYLMFESQAYYAQYIPDYHWEEGENRVVRAVERNIGRNHPDSYEVSDFWGAAATEESIHVYFLREEDFDSYYNVFDGEGGTHPSFWDTSLVFDANDWIPDEYKWRKARYKYYLMISGVKHLVCESIRGGWENTFMGRIAVGQQADIIQHGESSYLYLAVWDEKNAPDTTGDEYRGFAYQDAAHGYFAKKWTRTLRGKVEVAQIKDKGGNPVFYALPCLYYAPPIRAEETETVTREE
jgi:hypothetical protein